MAGVTLSKTKKIEAVRLWDWKAADLNLRQGLPMHILQYLLSQTAKPYEFHIGSPINFSRKRRPIQVVARKFDSCDAYPTGEREFPRRGFSGGRGVCSGFDGGFASGYAQGFGFNERQRQGFQGEPTRFGGQSSLSRRFQTWNLGGLLGDFSLCLFFTKFAFPLVIAAAKAEAKSCKHI